MNLSERLAKAAMERGRVPGGGAHRVQLTSVGTPPIHVSSESESTPAPLPDRVDGPVDPSRVAVMKMRLPDPAKSEPTGEAANALPLWQRPLIDVLRETGLATVTALPVVPFDDQDLDDDLEGGELAQTIPMPGVFMPSSVVDVDLTELHMPPLATSESQGLANGALRAEHDFDLGRRQHVHQSDDVIDLDAEIVDAEIVDGTSADVLLDRWSEGVSADVHDRQEKVDGLYRRMVDAVQQPRITFAPIDLRDEIKLPRADDDHTCPQCGAKARIDIHDPMRGRIHLSCDSCFKMWQERVESTSHSDEPFMRD